MADSGGIDHWRLAPMTFDIGAAAALVGRTETREATLHPEPARLLLATLDRDDRDLAPGDPLPLLWHWLYFPPTVRQGLLGADGHSHAGGLLPVLPELPRRMWAGSRLTSPAPLRLGDRVVRRTEVVSLTPKTGASGRLLFVTLRHELRGFASGAVREEQDLVFREPPRPGAAPAPPPPSRPAEFERTIEPTPPLLFRFSALTFNGHRIHYDRPYATEVEGYEGLVVHGPLQAVLMLDLLERARPQRGVGSFEFRAVAPACAPHSLAIKGAAAAAGFDLWIESRGRLISTAIAA
jgi:3-methylfumaryl-CoA hydratase